MLLDSVMGFVLDQINTPVRKSLWYERKPKTSEGYVEL